MSLNKLKYIITILMIYSLNCFGDTLDVGEVINLSPKFCKQGLINPPVENLFFKVYVFCDDGGGTQIGVILDRVTKETSGKWSNSNHFWQEGNWMSDVKAIVWSKSKPFLYVITSEVYSDESLYEIDLVGRKATKLLDGISIKQYLNFERVENDSITVNSQIFIRR